MSIALPTRPERTTAVRNWSANTAALAAAGLNFPADQPIDGDWVTARDGSLTSRSSDGRWWAGCSVPLLAGRSLLAALERGDPLTACLLHPEHAGIVLAARERVGPATVLIVVHSDPAVASHLLHAHDFSDPIRSRQTAFVFGENWQAALRSLFDRSPGLATPSRFVRTKLTADQTIDSMIAAAQTVFGQVTGNRTARLQSIRSAATPATPGRTLVIGGSAFQLWRPSVDELAADLGGAGLETIRFDTDDPLHGAPLALAIAADGCDAVVAADVFRDDARGMLAASAAWTTWVTRPVVAPFESAGPRDGVLLADKAWTPVARAAGWPAERIRYCGHRRATTPPPPAEPLLGVLGHHRPVIPPESVTTFSSHRLLWDAIEAELLENPLAIGGDIGAYLDNRAGQINLDPAELDRPAFYDRLIAPAYQRGLVTLLTRAGLPVGLFGDGWSDDPALIKFARGDLRCRADLDAAVAQCSALVHTLPVAGAHMIDGLGRLVVRATASEPFVRAARKAMAAGSPRQPAFKLYGDRPGQTAQHTR
jgi:hypothetical protein